jgi:hypothetical protein
VVLLILNAPLTAGTMKLTLVVLFLSGPTSVPDSTSLVLEDIPTGGMGSTLANACRMQLNAKSILQTVLYNVSLPPSMTKMHSQQTATAPRSTAHIRKGPAALLFAKATFMLIMPLLKHVALCLIQTQSVSLVVFSVSLDTPTDGLLQSHLASVYQFQLL